MRINGGKRMKKVEGRIALHRVGNQATEKGGAVAWLIPLLNAQRGILKNA